MFGDLVWIEAHAEAGCGRKGQHALGIQAPAADSDGVDERRPGQVFHQVGGRIESPSRVDTRRAVGGIIGSIMPTPRPFVQAACVCEKVLIEPDNVASLIRIVDTYTLRLPDETPVLPGVLGLDLSAFVSLKSGDVVGQFEIGLQLTDPEGSKQPIRKWPVILNGGEHGANLRLNFVLANPKHGLYWFDVLWNDEALTRIPFRIKFELRSDQTAKSNGREKQ
jgi:hypothetical protein